MTKNTFTVIFVIILLLAIGAIGWYWIKSDEELCRRIKFCDEPLKSNTTEKMEEKEEWKEDELLELKEQKINEGTEKYRVEAIYPYIMGEPEISANIQSLIDREVQKFKKEAEAIPITPFQAELIIKYDTKFASEDLLSLLLLTYSFMGGAHGLETPAGINYNLSTGQEITLETLLKAESGYLEFLSREARNKFRESLEGGFFEEGAGPLKSNFEDFTLTDTQVTFYFEPYQVAPYAAGIQELSIGLTELEPYLSESFKELYN